MGTGELSQKEITEMLLIHQARGWAPPSWELQVNKFREREGLEQPDLGSLGALSSKRK